MREVTVRRETDIAIVSIDHPPVNALGAAVRRDLLAALDGLEGEATLRAIVVAGCGATFMAGADIGELHAAARHAPSEAPDFHALMTRIENSPIPIVMAVQGAALGGGLELIMAGHYRVAERDARFGQPEVKLGLIPGAGGTQRLPRLVGVEQALRICITGEPVGAAEAKRLGIVDEVVEGDVLAGAVRLARGLDRGTRPPRTCSRPVEPSAGALLTRLLEAGRDLATRTWPGVDAARLVVDAVEAAATRPFEDGCRREREIFVACLGSTQARALMHLFFAEREASRVPGIAKPERMGRIGVRGAGPVAGGLLASLAAANVAAVGLPGPGHEEPVDLILDVTPTLAPALRVAPTLADVPAAAPGAPSVIWRAVAGSRLVEIAPTPSASRSALAAALAVSRRLGRVGVVARTPSATILDRSVRAGLAERATLVAGGTTAAALDAALASFGIQPGALRGGGEGPAGLLAPEADEPARRMVERVVLALVNEGARMLDEGEALRASDIDLVHTHGLGFPAWRGGALHWADQFGLDRALERIEDFRRMFGDRWAPAEVLRALVAHGQTFREHGAASRRPGG